MQDVKGTAMPAPATDATPRNLSAVLFAERYGEMESSSLWKLLVVVKSRQIFWHPSCTV